MKLADWARAQGIDYKTAYRWFRAGILPRPAIQLPTGTILVTEEAVTPKRGVAIYARVSSSDQKADLERQVGRLAAFATQSSMNVSRTASEVGSGLNGKRKKLIVIDPSETKDDLVQDVVDVLTSLCARLYGRRSAKNRAKRAIEALSHPEASGKKP